MRRLRRWLRDYEYLLVVLGAAACLFLMWKFKWTGGAP